MSPLFPGPITWLLSNRPEPAFPGLCIRGRSLQIRDHGVKLPSGLRTDRCWHSSEPSLTEERSRAQILNVPQELQASTRVQARAFKDLLEGSNPLRGPSRKGQ